jgi:type II secretory pathway component PulJ
LPAVLVTVFGFIVLVLALLGGIGLAIIRVIKSKSKGRDDESQAEEAKLMQELHQGLSLMEKRIEALETILLERQGPGKDQS